MRAPVIFAGTLALLAATALATEAKVDDGWDKVSDDDGITVYQRDSEGLATISLRGETTIDAKAADIVDVMKDNSIARDWVPMCQERRTLKVVGELERVELTHIRMPWPLTDRYFVNKGKAEYLADGRVKLFVQSVNDPETYFKNDELVLGILHYSEFMLTPMDGGKKTHIRLEVNTDPKGAVPKWIVNAAQKSWPRQFFQGLIGQLKKRNQLGGATPVAH